MVEKLVKNFVDSNSDLTGQKKFLTQLSWWLFFNTPVVEKQKQKTVQENIESLHNFHQ